MVMTANCLNKFISGISGCKSSDVAKSESCLSTVNETWNCTSDLRASVNNKSKELFSDDHTLKSFAGDELAYLEETQRRITTLHEELQFAANKLTTAHINLLKKLPLCARKALSSSRRKKENKRKVRKISYEWSPLLLSSNPMKFLSKVARNSRFGGCHFGELIAAWWRVRDVIAPNPSLAERLNHSTLLFSSFRIVFFVVMTSCAAPKRRNKKF